jgi:membrane protein implicated in regulation of membrane protease activity
MLRLRLVTSLGLLTCAIGLALRSLYGVLTSMFATISLVLVYCWWQSKSVAFLRNLEVADYNALSDLSHAGGLIGATWWDLLVFAIAAILFVWQVAIVIRVVTAPDDRFSTNVRTTGQ